MKRNRDGYCGNRLKRKEEEIFGGKFERGNWKSERENENQLKLGLIYDLKREGKLKKLPKLMLAAFRTKSGKKKILRGKRRGRRKSTVDFVFVFVFFGWFLINSKVNI